MPKKMLAAAAAIACLATGAAATMSPPPGLTGPMSAVVPVVEPGQIVKKPGFTPKGPIVKAPVLKKSPVVKTPVIVKKVPPKIIAPKVVSPPVLKKVPPVTKVVPGKFPPGKVIVKPHKKHNYYGTVIAGVVLGSILAASAYYAYTAPPSPDLCWYWTSPAKVRGYWDYCDPPEDD